MQSLVKVYTLPRNLEYLLNLFTKSYGIQLHKYQIYIIKFTVCYWIFVANEKFHYTGVRGTTYFTGDTWNLLHRGEIHFILLSGIKLCRYKSLIPVIFSSIEKQFEFTTPFVWNSTYSSVFLWIEVRQGESYTTSREFSQLIERQETNVHFVPFGKTRNSISLIFSVI